MSDKNNESFDVESNVSVEQSEHHVQDEVEQEIDNTSDDAVSELQKEIETLKDRLMRSEAEQVNMTSRFNREMKKNAKYVVNNFALDVLKIVDNLELALKASKKDKNIHTGISMVYQECLSILSGRDIKQQVVNVGDDFDADKHEAVEIIEVSDQPDGKIHTVKSHGYMENNNVLRHAKVAVSKKVDDKS